MVGRNACDMSISQDMNPLRERLQRVLDAGLVADKKNWALSAGLSDGAVRSWMSQAVRDPAKGMNQRTIRLLADAAGVRLEWLADGRGEMLVAPGANAEGDPAVAELVGEIADQVRAWAESVRAEATLAQLKPKQALAVLREEWRSERGFVPAPRVPEGDHAAEVLAMPVPRTPVAGGRVLFLKHIAKAKPAQLAEAEEFIERFLAAQNAASAEAVAEDIKDAWKQHKKGAKVRRAPDDDSEYQAELAKRRGR